MALLNPFGGALGRKHAAHLLKRATFGPTKQRIDQFSNMTAAQAVGQLFTAAAEPSPPRDVATGQAWNNPKPVEDVNSQEFDLIYYFRGWWLELMMKEGMSLTERMTFFMHIHFTSAFSVVGRSTALYYQNALYRKYALGNFKELAKKVCTDNAMLVYLDGRLNDKDNPNENFGREFLELFTIGKGPQIGLDDYTNYTEQDVQAASRVVSGYKNDNEFLETDIVTGLKTGILKINAENQATRHDPGVKTFSAAFGGATIQPNALMDGLATKEAALDELDQLVNLVFGQIETAKYLCRRLYRFFVYYEITDEIEQDIITPLANTFQSNNYEIKPVLQQLLTSQHFYDTDNAIETDDNRGAIIKSPIDLVIGTLKFFKVVMPDSSTEIGLAYDTAYRSLIRRMDEQGLRFYDPPEVAGYSAYHQTPEFNRNWISNIWLLRRYEFADFLLTKGEDQGFQLDTVAYVDNPQHISDPADPQALVQELIDDLFPEIITQVRFDYFMNDILLDNLSAVNWAGEWNNYKITGDDTNVKVQLDALFRALLQSPEYQLY